MALVTNSVAGLANSPHLEDELVSHLSTEYGMSVSEVNKLDMNIFRVDEVNGAKWVVRMFPSTFQHNDIEDEAEILCFLRSRTSLQSDSHMLIPFQEPPQGATYW